MAWSATSARALLAASPIASVQPTAIGERITPWLKITAVPLCVFLIGACIWGCIKNTAAWRVLTQGGGGNTRDGALGKVRSDAPRAASNNEAAKGEQVREQIAWSSLEWLGGSESSLGCHAHCSGLELARVRCSDVESDAECDSNQALVPSLQMRPCMETLAPTPTSEGGAVSR